MYMPTVSSHHVEPRHTIPFCTLMLRQVYYTFELGLYISSYFRLDLNTATFVQAAKALLGMVGWEEVPYSFLTDTQGLFGTFVTLNDNLVVAPLKPTLLALNNQALQEILKVS